LGQSIANEGEELKEQEDKEVKMHSPIKKGGEGGLTASVLSMESPFIKSEIKTKQKNIHH
jgi:hypothetical protein